MRRTLLAHDPALKALPRPPQWLPFQRLPGTTPIDLGPLAHTPLTEFVLTMLRQIIRLIFNDVLNHALLYPRIVHNLHEPALALIEHGLIPLSSDDEAAYLYCYNPEPVATPAWLPYFTLARAPDEAP